MTHKYLLFFGLLSLNLLGISGCAQQMAKQDSITSPPAAQASTQQDAGQTKAAAAETATAQDKTPAAATGAATPKPGSRQGACRAGRAEGGQG